MGDAGVGCKVWGSGFRLRDQGARDSGFGIRVWVKEMLKGKTPSLDTRLLRGFEMQGKRVRGFRCLKMTPDCLKWCDRFRVGEVPREEKVLYSGTDPESYITECTPVFEE